MRQDRLNRAVKEIQASIDEDEGAVFSEKVIREFNEPQNVGRMNDPDGCAEVQGPCGDTMEFYLHIRRGIVESVLFYTDGCGPTIACGSMLTRMVKGKNIGEIELIGSEDLIKALGGLPEVHAHCASLAVHTMIQALRNYQRKVE